MRVSAHPQPPITPRRRYRLLIAVAAAITAASLMAGCGITDKHWAATHTTTPLSPAVGDHQPVKRSNLGAAWPFTVDHGTITCRNITAGALASFTAPNGRSYALNQVARQIGYPSVQSIRNGFSLGAITGHALHLCHKQ